MNATRASLWPTDSQMLLLRAALEEAPTAFEAFDHWCDAVDLAGPVDPGSLGLLPLVHHNLAGAETLRHAGLVAGVRRRSFVESHRAIGAAAEAIEVLDRAGIPTMVIKGVPLALAYYPVPGLRPMGDADLLVPSRHAEAALAALESADWRTANGFEARRARHLLLNHGIEMRKGSGPDVDVHWQPVHETVSPAVERQLWANAQPILVSGVATLRPDASALLMLTMLHGLRSNFKAPLRWIPDAVMILRKDNDRIDWNWLLAVSQEGRTSYRLGLGLRFLAEHFGVDIPASVMAEAARSQPSLVERLENRFVLGEEPGPLSASSYKAALLLRMMSGTRRGAVPTLLWREVRRHAGLT